MRKWLDFIPKLLTTILATLGILSAAWTAVLNPIVDEKIRCSATKIESELVYIKIMLLVTMDSTQVNTANRIYDSWIKGK